MSVPGWDLAQPSGSRRLDNLQSMGNNDPTAGRMYVPLTRQYGTTSTKSFMNLDLNWSHGSIRCGIFYPSKVDRDDGVCLWGNVMDDRFQYRFMLSGGIGDNDMNPGDHPRFAGRVS